MDNFNEVTSHKGPNMKLSEINIGAGDEFIFKNVMYLQLPCRILAKSVLSLDANANLQVLIVGELPRKSFEFVLVHVNQRPTVKRECFNGLPKWTC